MVAWLPSALSCDGVADGDAVALACIARASFFGFIVAVRAATMATLPFDVFVGAVAYRPVLDVDMCLDCC